MAREQLEEAKLQAEIDKLLAETESVRKQGWLRLSELIKVTGAVVATILATAAAITTYKITQLETRQAKEEKAKVIAERDAATRERDKVRRDLERTEAQRDQAIQRRIAAEGQLSKASAALEETQSRLTLLKTESDSTAKQLEVFKSDLIRARQTVLATLPQVAVASASGRGEIGIKLETDLTSDVVKLLSENGFRVTLVQDDFSLSRAFSRPPASTEVIVFYEGDRDDATRLINILKEARVPAVMIRKSDANRKPREFEVHLGRDTT